MGGYIANRGESCFYCKSHLYSTLEVLAADALSQGSSSAPNVLFNGTNADDRSDETRVGLVAAEAYSVASPIDTLTKHQVREVARELGLPNWDVAASPCLRSRLAFGVEATASSLQLVERGEKMVRSALQLGDTRNLRL